jgi:hypothetical protein
MTTAELLATLHQRGVNLKVEGDRLRYCPRSAVTPELASQMKLHKNELMAAVQPPEASNGYCPDCGTSLVETPTFDGFQNLECPSCDRCFGCRPESVEIAERFKSRGEPVTFVDEGGEPIGEVAPCGKCGSIELWKSMAGTWRCLNCDPPSVARRLRRRAEELRRRYAQTNNNAKSDQ